MAGFLNSFIRHADVVKIANLAQIVNVIAPILTRGNEMLIQSIFYPFEMFSRAGTASRSRPGRRAIVREQATRPVTYIDTSAILDGSRLHVFLTNRGMAGTAPVRISLMDQSIAAFERGEVMCGPAPKAANSFEEPGVIAYGPLEGITLAAGRADLELPPLSVAAATFRLE